MTVKRGQEKLVCVAKILGAHGVKGLVKVETFTEHPKNLFNYGPLFYETGQKAPRLTFKSLSGECLIAEWEGIGSREEAAKKRGERLYVSKAALPPPKPGEYYEAEIIGLEVHDTQGNVLGQVLSFHDHGAGLFVEIGSSKKDSFMLPFKDAFVPEVDLAQGRIIVSLPQGWP